MKVQTRNTKHQRFSKRSLINERMTSFAEFSMVANTPQYGLYLQREDAYKEMLIEHYEMFNAKPNFDGILILNDMCDNERGKIWSSEYMITLHKTHMTEMLNHWVMLLFKKV